jgi:hypothetical protein
MSTTMNLTEFEKRVLEGLIEGDPEEDVFLAQIQGAFVLDRDYTGVGLFTKIQVSEDAPRLRENRGHYPKSAGMYLRHPELASGAGIMLWLDEGKVSILECYTFDGDWPKDESKFTIGT